MTETPEVQAALDELRAVAGSDTVDLGELVKLGAAQKVQELRETQRADADRLALRQRFAQRTRSGEGIDLDALRDVHENGWAHG